LLWYFGIVKRTITLIWQASKFYKKSLKIQLLSCVMSSIFIIVMFKITISQIPTFR